MNELERMEHESAEAERFDTMLADSRADDLDRVLRTPYGRRFIGTILADSGIEEDAFTGNSRTYYNLGRQAAGRQLRAEIRRIDPSYLWWIEADQLGEEHAASRHLRTLLNEVRGVDND